MNPPKMPIHIGDLLRDTGHLRNDGIGSYLLLLFHHWSTGSLPDDDEQLATIARTSRAEWKRMRPVLEKFFKPGWRHGRVEEDLEAARASYEKRAKAGEKGGKAKADNKQSYSNATAGPEQPLTFNQSKKDIAPDGASTPVKLYAFEDGIIRLTEKDFSKWKASFSNIDVAAELLSMSEWLAREHGTNWFHAAKGLLAKRNREAKAASARGQLPLKPTNNPWAEEGLV